VKVLLLAAHGGFRDEGAPLGGGAAVCDLLLAEWARTQPFEVQLFRPERLSGRQIVDFDTRAYARFCREFGAASTAFVLGHDPRGVVVVSNDISEGPDFRLLAARGYRVVTLWHVDVVAYIAAMYARGRVSPRTLVRLERVFGWLGPSILNLIFAKQRDCLRHSRAHVLPSPAMKATILDTFPEVAEGKLHVVPWGAPPADEQPLPPRAEARGAFGIPVDATVLLLLSRLSPEKNQQALFSALRGFRPVHVLICGAAAYMQGRSHEALLRSMAASLPNVTAIFAGHVQGERKRQALAAADLYVFPSKHESYGLTLMEAFQAGLPALTLDHAGAAAVMRPEFGAVATERTLRDELARLLRADLPAMGRAAREYALRHPFREAAARVAERVVGSGSE